MRDEVAYTNVVKLSYHTPKFKARRITRFRATLVNYDATLMLNEAILMRDEETLVR